jgi:signal transduction histidine kinase/DNA-binding response OmpR family regulator
VSGAPPEAAFAGQSREFRLLCDREGRLTWLDERAERLLGLRRGASLREAASPGASEKLARMLAGASESADEPWEVVFHVGGAPQTVALRARPAAEGGLAITGSLLPSDYGRALDQLSANLSEMSALHRETERQQRELLRRHEELVRLYRELEESNKGVIALHAEIGEKDDSIRRASEVKARLVANVSHEFRTPLNSILGLTKLLLARSDGELNEEQEKQLQFILQSTEALYTLVNDLLDLSKMEAGKAMLRANSFTAEGLLSSLRGMLRPLVNDAAVEFVVEAPREEIWFETDEGKIAQVLRNLVSNALKFTERGEVRVRAFRDGASGVFEVRDTGIGIAPDDLGRVFEEFFQAENPLQRRVKGTGLGLSLSRHLAERLGGTLAVESAPGRGSVFTLRVPLRHPEVDEMAAMAERGARVAPGHAPILVIEDDRQTLFLYEKYLRGSGFHVVPARTLDDARAALRRFKPAAVVLDVMLDGEASWSFLHELKENPETRDVPALVVTVTNREDKARALGADEFYMKPLDRDWLLGRLKALARHEAVETVLVIDDDEVSRYLVRKQLEGSPYKVVEASGGREGVRLARERLPQVILLDFVMPEMGAFDVLDELKKDPMTRSIPVIIHTSKSLLDDERKRLEAEASAILSKQSLSREIAIARIREALAKSMRTAPGPRQEG